MTEIYPSLSLHYQSWPPSQNLRGQSRGFNSSENGYRRREKYAPPLMYWWSSQGNEAHNKDTHYSCVGSPNPEELLGKRRDRPKQQRAQLRSSGLNPENFTKATREVFSDFGAGQRPILYPGRFYSAGGQLQFRPGAGGTVVAFKKA
nr:uncharacterized protein LOC108054391 isoform X1 [Drosophila takahashii]XP_044248723.1 uncharacterized protein LOC108054391 isoform X1 [Drosophila takahashii]